jgi:Cystathionine beta-lyases/cystathionine gamma-synthases
MALGRATEWGLAVELADMTDPQRVSALVRPGRTRLIWAESPANPMWQVADLAALAEIAHGAGALLAVDSTSATPLLTQPIALGADLVMHAATKYLNGHSDVLAGTLTTARKDEFWERIRICAPAAVPCSAASRPGCSCAACARCRCG